MDKRDIKTKRPWKRIRPEGYMRHGTFMADNEPPSQNDPCYYTMVTQSDFMREYYPSGHVINDHEVYPDIYRMEEEPVLDENGEPTGKTSRRIYKELVPRYSFAFQQIITVKQTVHLCGNDIQFELTKDKPSEKDIKDFLLFKEGWLKKNMEIAFFEAVKSTKITGDAAIVGYLRDGKFGYKTLSYQNGDTLYPHYDPITNKMNLFARSYYDYDDLGNRIIEWLEVLDNTALYRYKRANKGAKGAINRILGIFGIDGYELVDKSIHGFPFLPVAYRRDEDGACWSPSQDACDGYEMSFSQMAQNNQAFGFPIMYLQGEGSDSMAMQHDLNGSVKIITGGPEDKASFLSQPDASESFVKQLDTLYKMIYEQSFAVIPPELKSGDLPAAALKILYSPAYEKALIDSAEYQPFLDDMVKIFTYGFGVEKEKSIDFINLPINWWIKPYIHVNESAMVADLASAVQNGFISRQTASERIPMYSVTGEWERIVREAKEEQQNDLLSQIELANANRGSNTGS